MNTQNQILEIIKHFNIEQQYKLLEFIKSIKPIKKTRGKDITKFAGKISKADLLLMKSAIN